MKAVLISIHPKWVDKILNGKKTIEVRKTRPKIKTPFKCFIYMTAGGYEWQKEPFSTAVVPNPDGTGMYNGSRMVVAEFTCDWISTIAYTMDGFADVVDCKTSGLSPTDFIEYGKGKPLYGWHISGLKVYDKPKELGDFTPHCRFMTDDMQSCDHHKIACNHQHFDHNPWPDCSLNAVICKRRMKRPPQSWCYVEDTIHDKEVE